MQSWKVCKPGCTFLYCICTVSVHSTYKHHLPFESQWRAISRLDSVNITTTVSFLVMSYSRKSSLPEWQRQFLLFLGLPSSRGQSNIEVDLSRRLCSHYLLKFPKPNWTMPWTIWSEWSWPYWEQEVGLETNLNESVAVKSRTCCGFGLKEHCSSWLDFRISDLSYCQLERG